MGYQSIEIRRINVSVSLIEGFDHFSPFFDIGGAIEIQGILRISGFSVVSEDPPSPTLEAIGQTSVDSVTWADIEDGASPLGKFNFGGAHTASGTWTDSARSADGYNISRYLRFRYHWEHPGVATFGLDVYVKD